jgi:hypothetical protein
MKMLPLAWGEPCGGGRFAEVGRASLGEHVS